MKSQVSIEFLIIVGIALLILIPVMIYANETISATRDELKISLARNAVNRIGEASEWVATQGSPAKTTIRVFIPEGVREIDLTGKTITIKLNAESGLRDIYRDTLTDLNGSISNTAGYVLVSVEAFDNFVNLSVVQ